MTDQIKSGLCQTCPTPSACGFHMTCLAQVSRTPAKAGEDGVHIDDAGKMLREAAQPFLDLLAGIKPSAPLYEIALPIYPEGVSHPYDWRVRINALRDALSTIKEPRG